jgi:periplasmic protein TonB
MFGTLLESRSNRGRSPGGAVVSLTAHTALIAAAVFATAQAHLEPLRPAETVRPVFFPPRDAIAAASPEATQQHAPTSRQLVFIEPRIEITIPPVDMTGLVSRPDDFGPAAMGSPVSLGGGEIAANPGDAPFRSDQVDRQVAVAPGNAPPRYPELLRSSGVEGQVTAVFVVDELGRAEDGSVRFTRSDNPLFEEAVKAALRRMRFIPAEFGGRKVRQLVQMPFLFTLSR